MFVDAGLGKGLRGVPEDEEGIDIEFLRAELEKMPDSDLAVSCNDSVFFFCSLYRSRR